MGEGKTAVRDNCVRPVHPRPTSSSLVDITTIDMHSGGYGPSECKIGRRSKTAPHSFAPARRSGKRPPHRQLFALRALVKRAIKSSDIRKDLDPIDLLRAIVGVANVSASPDWQQSARRLVDILIAGARPLK